jgi:H+/Cl- antiporter ClcA
VVITTWWGTGAMGSGVAEIIGYVNGINYHDCINPKTLITKIFGVTLAVAGGLTVGKEGPLAHIGGNLGALVPYITGADFMKNDASKRLLIAAGASAGVSIAFGAPIGGALFIYELSLMNPFWNFSLLWKVFITTSTATFTLGLCDGLLHKKPVDWSEDSLKFGVANKDLTTSTAVIAGAFIIGIVSGLLGPFFININTRINAFRG